MTADIRIRNARPMGGAPVDLVIRNGRFGKADGTQPKEEIDATGYIALPGLVEAHTHLDKTLIGMDWYENRVGPTRNHRILADRQAKRALGIDARRQSARQTPIVKVFIDWLFSSLEESLPEPQTSARMLLRGRGGRAAEPLRPTPVPAKRRTASSPPRKTRA